MFCRCSGAFDSSWSIKHYLLTYLLMFSETFDTRRVSHMVIPQQPPQSVNKARSLWKNAILEQRLLIRMEKENRVHEEGNKFVER